MKTTKNFDLHCKTFQYRLLVTIDDHAFQVAGTNLWNM